MTDNALNGTPAPKARWYIVHTYSGFEHRDRKSTRLNSSHYS